MTQAKPEQGGEGLDGNQGLQALVLKHTRSMENIHSGAALGVGSSSE